MPATAAGGLGSGSGSAGPTATPTSVVPRSGSASGSSLEPPTASESPAGETDPDSAQKSGPSDAEKSVGLMMGEGGAASEEQSGFCSTEQSRLAVKGAAGTGTGTGPAASASTKMTVSRELIDGVPAWR